jgi:hypothetical protein
MKAKYFGWEFREAIEAATHKIASDLGLSGVTVIWNGGITTANINSYGVIHLANVKDDALLTRSDLMKYSGFVIHELLHRKYTDFDATSSIQYVHHLCNALEDARIEHLAIDNQLTGNVTQLLTVLIDRMVSEALAEVTDWTDPRQYPFVLAVYTRKHAAVKVPLALGLAPIFDEAVIRLETCADSTQTLKLAQWVFDQLQVVTPPPPEPPPKPPVNPPEPPTRPDQGEDEGEGRDEGDKPSDKPTKPTDKPPVGPVKRPNKQTEAVNVEPVNKPDNDQHSSNRHRAESSILRDKAHVGSVRRFPILF